MPRYFFDIHDGSALTRDTYGIECDCRDHLREEVFGALPDFVRLARPSEDNNLAVTILVRDESNVTVFTACLNLAGFWLGDSPIPEPEDDPFD